MLITCTNNSACRCTCAVRYRWSNTRVARLASSMAATPTHSAFHNDCRTACGMRPSSPAPTSCATTLLIAIMVPLTVTRMIDQIDAPSDTAPSSSALAWPVIATSATPMPTVASWPISIGQARRHRAAVSRRRLGRVKECGMRGGREKGGRQFYPGPAGAAALYHYIFLQISHIVLSANTLAYALSVHGTD